VTQHRVAETTRRACSPASAWPAWRARLPAVRGSASTRRDGIQQRAGAAARRPAAAVRSHYGHPGGRRQDLLSERVWSRSQPGQFQGIQRRLHAHAVHRRPDRERTINCPAGSKLASRTHVVAGPAPSPLPRSPEDQTDQISLANEYRRRQVRRERRAERRITAGDGRVRSRGAGDRAWTGESAPERRRAGSSSHATACAHGGAGAVHHRAGVLAVIALWWSTPLRNGLGDWLTKRAVSSAPRRLRVVVLGRAHGRFRPGTSIAPTGRPLARDGRRYVVSVIVAHATLITWAIGHGGRERGRETKTLLLSYRCADGDGGGSCSWYGLMSARAARRRINYDTWYTCTFTPTWPSRWRSVTSSRTVPRRQQPQGAFVWSLMYASVAALLIWYRVLTRAQRAAAPFHVVALRGNPGRVSVYIGVTTWTTAAEPGQFFRCGSHPGMWWSSILTRVRSPRPDVMRITVKDRVITAGRQPAPAGTRSSRKDLRAFTRPRQRRCCCWRRSGITPLRAMFATLPARHAHLPGEQPDEWCSARS